MIMLNSKRRRVPVSVFCLSTHATYGSPSYCVLQFKQHLSVISLWCLFLGHAGFFMHHELGFHNHFCSSSLQTKICLLCYWSSLFLSSWHATVCSFGFFVIRNERTLKLFNIFKSLHLSVSWYKRNVFLGILMQTPTIFVKKNPNKWTKKPQNKTYTSISGCMKDASSVR